MKSNSVMVFLIFGLACFSGCSNSTGRKNATKDTLDSSISTLGTTETKSGYSLLIYDEFRSVFESGRYLCVISYSNECPIAKSYIRTIKDLVRDYGDTIQFCLLDPGVGTRSISGLESLLFHDLTGVICRRFYIKVYPQAVVYNCLTREIIYSGKIDDRVVSLGVISARATKNYLSDVLANVRLGKSNDVVSNEAIGCFVGPFEGEK